MTTDRTWTMRAYQEGSENDMFELDRVLYGEAVPDRQQWLEGWKWMYADNPAGDSIIWLADQDDKMVGQYPLVIEDMNIRGKPVKGSQVADTMTHPEYRRQGIATLLGNQALNQLKDKDVALTFGFPTPQVYPIHIKAGWFDVCPFQVMVKPFNVKKVLKSYLGINELMLPVFTASARLLLKTLLRTRKPPPVDKLVINEVSHFDERFDDFWERVSGDYAIIVARNRSYLNWRYIDSPNVNFVVYAAEIEDKIYGYIVLGIYKDYDRKDLKIGCIYDIIARLDDEDIVHNLVSKAIDCFHDEKADVIFSQMVAHKIYRKVLSKNGFIPNFRSKSRFIAYTVSPGEGDEFIKDSRNWFIQLGDLPTVY
ncbi:GNAT family N-acetyltransferase [Chloroflexota bacterium]